jgi:hypothetical protein
MLGEHRASRIEAPLHPLRILHDAACEHAGVLRVVGGLAIAIHVGDEGRIAVLREAPRLVVDVLRDAPPFVHQDDARPLTLLGVVVDDEALHRRFAVLVGDQLFPDVRDRAARNEQCRGDDPVTHEVSLR